MNVFEFPSKQDWPRLLQRPAFALESLQSSVRAILDEVKLSGDEAIRKFTQQFDGAYIDQLEVSKEEIEDAASGITTELFDALRIAASNIRLFHRQQLLDEERVETLEGISCWRKSVPIQKVGLYIPGGTAPLFSTVLMLAIPAKLAGCSQIIVCTPPQKDGSVHPAIINAAKLAGVTAIYKAGGVQAIGAMAFGTQTVPKVSKIFGPGNQYVTVAKQLIQNQGVAIDMPAGPSEVAVYGDESANAEFVASDLISQAEHGPDSQTLLATTSRQLIEKVINAIERQVETLPRQDFIRKSLANSRFILLSTPEECMEIINEYAPEHLILASDDAERLASMVVNAGSVFLGHFSPESVGDYASGTNHVLPTNGYAHAYSGVSIDSFVKKITFQQLTETGLENIGDVVERMASAEGLEAHSRAVQIRRSFNQNSQSK
jgi:histidinol dehydrogenase